MLGFCNACACLKPITRLGNKWNKFAVDYAPVDHNVADTHTGCGGEIDWNERPADAWVPDPDCGNCAGIGFVVGPADPMCPCMTLVTSRTLEYFPTCRKCGAEPEPDAVTPGTAHCPGSRKAIR